MTDCKDLKQELEHTAERAGLRTRSRNDRTRVQFVSRLAIEELEAWFFGDWNAVQQAYPAVNSHVPNQKSYRDPDGIAGGTWEALERVLRRAGYFRTGLRKIEAARAIAQHMEPHRNRSHSFRVFRDALAGMSS